MVQKLDSKDLTPDAINGIVAELRTEIKGLKGEETGAIKELRDVVADIEVKNQEVVKKLENEITKNAEKDEMLKKQHDLLEKALSRPEQSLGDQDQAKLEMKHFEKFVKKGGENMNDELEVKFMNTYNDADGGILAPAEYVNEIVKDITEVSNIRSVARVRTAGAGRMTIPVRGQLITANWEGEAETASDSNSKYKSRNLKLNKLMVNVPITVEELNDAAFNMESEINADVAEVFAQKEGAGFVSGLGAASNQPEGFVNNSEVYTLNSGAAADFTMDNIVTLAGELKTGYNPIYVMNRKSVAYAQNLKESGTGRYLWQAGNIAAGVPNQLNGYNYLELPDMDDVAANAIPVAFGDFRQGYLIGEGAELTLIRDPYSRKKEGMVEFTFMRRVTGQVIKPEAIKLLKCST